MFQRSTLLKAITPDFKPDLIVIGGGITGAGIFLDAQSRGINTLLIEMQDFGSGTSSRSTKLIHGGLRYLKQFDFKVVQETGLERKIVRNLAPHLTRELRVRLPIQKNGSLSRFATKIALTAYEYLADVDPSQKHEFFDKKTLHKKDKLKTEGLKGGYDYLEYQTDDARLVIENIKKGVEIGGIALNYCKVDVIHQENGHVTGVSFTDTLDGEHFEVKSTNIISAAGPWVDEVCRLEDETKPDKLTLTKGVHLVFERQKFPLSSAYYFDTSDSRMIFAIPHENTTYVGTTDTIYTHHKTSPKTSLEDVNYLLENLNERFETQLKEEDIISSWSGLRPLIQQKGKGPSEISRKDEIFVSETGLFSIAGGKLTGYRQMAKKILDKLVVKNKIECLPCWTEELKLSGGDFSQDEQTFLINRVAEKAVQLGVSKEQTDYIFSKFGNNSFQILNNINMYSDFVTQYKAPHYLLACLQYCMEYESAIKPLDIIVRRLGLLYFEPFFLEEHKIDIIDYMSAYYKWSPEKRNEYLDELNEEIYNSKNFK